MLNELFRTYKKIIFIVLLLLCAIVFWFFGCHREPNEEAGTVIWEKNTFDNDGYGYSFRINDLEGDVVFGIKGYTVKDKNIPIEVGLTSSARDFSGLVSITVPGTNGTGICYQSAIQCKKGERSNIDLSIPQLGNAAYFCFEILDQFGNTLLSKMEIPAYSEWVDPESETGSQICLGLLSDQFSTLSFLDGTVIDTGFEEVRLRLVPLDENSFPSSQDSINILSGILVDDYSLGKLVEGQRVVLRNWLNQGGNLIIATGEHGKKNLTAFGDELKVEPGDVDTERLYFDASGDFSGELSLYINHLIFDNNAGWRTIRWSDPAALYERSFGAGSVYALRFSFTDASILQWNHLDEMTQSLMKQVFRSVFEENADEENLIWNIEMALHDFNSSQTPNVFYYGVFFLAYLCTLTFLAYYMLNRIRKREYIWGLVPMVAILFSLSIVFRSRSTPSQVQSSFSSIRIVDDQNTRNDLYFLYQNEEGESMNVNLSSSVDSVLPIDFDYAQEAADYTQLTMIQKDYSILDAIKGYDISFSEATPGTIRMLQMTENKIMNYGEKTDIFSTDIRGNHTTFSGSLTNQSKKTFDKVLIIRGNEYWIDENIKAGETVNISGEEVKAWSQFDDDTVLAGGGDSVVMQDILSYVLYRYMKNNSDMSDLIVIGLALDDNYQLLRTRNITLGNQVSVYACHMDIGNPETADCQVDINRESLQDYEDYDDLTSRISEGETVEVEYQFDSNKLVWAMARNHDDFKGKIYAYNYETSEKDRILRNWDDVMSLTDLEPYLSDMNVMKITYEQAKNEEEYNLPILSAWLKKIAH